MNTLNNSWDISAGTSGREKALSVDWHKINDGPLDFCTGRNEPQLVQEPLCVCWNERSVGKTELSWNLSGLKERMC